MQEHSKEFSPSIQVPPFLQGSDEHSLIFCIKKCEKTIIFWETKFGKLETKYGKKHYL